MDRRRQHRDQVHLGRQSPRARWRGLALFGVLAGWLFAHPAQAANCTYRQDALGHTRYRCDRAPCVRMRSAVNQQVARGCYSFFYRAFLHHSLATVFSLAGALVHISLPWTLHV